VSIKNFFCGTSPLDFISIKHIKNRTKPLRSTKRHLTSDAFGIFVAPCFAEIGKKHALGWFAGYLSVRAVKQIGCHTEYRQLARSSDGFSLLRPIPMKEKISYRITHLVSRIEVSSQIQTRRVKKTHRITHLNFLTVCYNKRKSVLNNTNIHKL
jgi:hypothetical protein